MRSTSQAIAYIENLAKRRINIGQGWCMQRSREAYGIPAAGDVDHDKDADAVDGRKTATLKRLSPDQCPKGGFIWWSGGRNGHGHVAVPLGSGMCWTPGGPGDDDHWVKMRIADVTSGWGLQWEGWSPNFNGVTVVDPNPAPKPDPAPAAKTRGPNVDAAIAAAERAVKANTGKTGTRPKDVLAKMQDALRLMRSIPAYAKRTRR